MYTMRPIVGAGLVWLVPFFASCFLIGPDGTKFVSEQTFKNTLVFFGSTTGSYCTYQCDPKTWREGAILSGWFLVVNWVLDLIVLVPLLVLNNNDDGDNGDNGSGELTAETYAAMVPVWFQKTGFQYIGYMSVCVVAGGCAERAGKTKQD
jgi:hypothetical protein